MREAHIFTDSEETKPESFGEMELKTLIWHAYSSDGETMVEQESMLSAHLWKHDVPFSGMGKDNSSN